METQIFSPCKKNIIFKKKQSSQRNQNPSRYYNSLTNLSSFNISQKYPSFKNPHIKKNRPIIIIISGYLLIVSIN
jgi:hypothetical protein